RRGGRRGPGRPRPRRHRPRRRRGREEARRQEEVAPGVAELALEVRDLVKVYDAGSRGKGSAEVRALDGLSLEVAAGETLGLLGPNGAGKTTAIRTIATLVRPTSGTVKIGGIDVLADPDGARMRLGYVPQELSLDRM